MYWAHLTISPKAYSLSYQRYRLVVISHGLLNKIPISLVAHKLNSLREVVDSCVPRDL